MARDWREGEIRDIARQVQTDALAQIQKDFEKLRDGAQASINTALLLHGDESLNIRGAIPEMRERMLALEEQLVVIPEMQRDIEALKARTGRIGRWTKATYRFLTSADSEGKPTWRRLIALGGGFGALGYGLNVATAHLHTLKTWIVRVLWR
jgi:hypothetical protein